MAILRSRRPTQATPPPKMTVVSLPPFDGDVNSPVEFPPLPMAGRRNGPDNGLRLNLFQAVGSHAETRLSSPEAGQSGCPPPASPRDPRPDSVSTGPTDHRHTPTPLVGSAANMDLTPNVPTPTITSPSNTRLHKGKHRWKRVEKADLYWCYNYCKTKQLLPLGKSCYKLWRERNPLLCRTMDVGKLDNQRRSVMRTMTEIELSAVETSVLEYIRAEEERTEDLNSPEIPTNYLPPVLDEANKNTTPAHKKELLVAYDLWKRRPLSDRKRPKTFSLSPKHKETLAEVNEALASIIVDMGPNVTMVELNTLQYATAVTIAGASQTGDNKPVAEPTKDPDARIKTQIERTRKWLARLTSVAKGSKMTHKVKSILKKRTVQAAIQSYRMRLAAMCKTLRTKQNNRNRFRNNKLHRFKVKSLYSKFRYGESAGITSPPTADAVKNYWGGLFGDKKDHNHDADWIPAEEREMEGKPKATWVDVSVTQIGDITSRLANWKAPGLDQVQNFWLKYLVALHPTMAKVCNVVAKNPALAPPWLTGGRTTLIHKKGPTDVASNYRPITCLPTIFKLMTLVMTDRIYSHVTTNYILPFEQKGCRRKARGCKDHLLLDKAIIEDSKRKKKKVSYMWIDYKKAYDSIPHTWLIKILKLYKIDDITSNFIQYLMPMWRTRIHLPFDSGSVTTGEITFKRGIFQGDSLSPLLFCLALAPLTNMLKRAGVGYRIGGRIVSHLLYVDDLKVFARSPAEMEVCRRIIKKFSDDICMDFGLEKCAVIHTTNGKIDNSPYVVGIPLLSSEDSYKYLGILECDNLLHKEVKAAVYKEYLKRLRAILKADLTAKNTVVSIGSFAMPVLRYGFGVLRWTVAELKSMDTKTRKVLAKAKFHHPRSSTHRLYIARKDGGRGLVGVVDCHRQECTKLAEYVEKATDPLVGIVRQMESRRVHGLMSWVRVHGKGGTTESINEEHVSELLKLRMQGQFFSQTAALPAANKPESDEWLHTSHLRFETESLICAAQEQALATKVMQAKIWKTGGTSLCRMCHEHDETIMHIVSGCKMLCGNKYMRRHDQIGTYLHWHILKDLGVKVSKSWLVHKPADTITVNGITVYWDQDIITGRKIGCNRPDITIWDSIKKTAKLIDMSVPMDYNVVTKTAEKLIKYRSLEIEIQKCWGLKKVDTIPIIIGALGTVCDNLKVNLMAISANAKVSTIQKTALLGTAHILRTFLKRDY